MRPHYHPTSSQRVFSSKWSAVEGVIDSAALAPGVSAKCLRSLQQRNRLSWAGWREASGPLERGGEQSQEEVRRDFIVHLFISLSIHSRIFYWAPTKCRVLFRHRRHSETWSLPSESLYSRAALSNTVTMKFKYKLIKTKSNWKFSYSGTCAHFKCS